MIYFDFAATTPLDPDAAAVYLNAAANFYGNANSLHDIGSEAAFLLENCRKELANLLGVDSKGLFFTSGGSEGNFLAIEALLSARLKEGNHIITSIAEHSSIHGEMKRLEQSGYEITYLPMNREGVVDCRKLFDSIRPETVLVTIQHINSEIGTIQPIATISEYCQKKRILFHSDFVQSVGKMDVKHVASLVSSFSFSGHKFSGPKGIGGVYLNPSLPWRGFFPEITHEGGFRPGTVNVAAIAAMTAAAKKAASYLTETTNKYKLLRQVLIAELKPIEKWLTIYRGKESFQLPCIIGMGVSGIEGQWLMLECNRNGFAISTGSACHIGLQAPARTMQALELPAAQAKEFIRISFGSTTTIEEVRKLAKTIVNIVNQFKTSYS